MEAPKRWVKRCLIFFILLLPVTVGAFYLYLKSPIALPCEKVVYQLPPGKSAKFIANDLYQRHIIQYPRLFEWSIRLLGQDKHLAKGQYAIHRGTTVQALIHKLVRGDILLHVFRIKEGSTIYDLIAALQTDANIVHKMDYAQDNWLSDITQQYQHPEGLFMPDTYLIPNGETDKAILKRAYQTLMDYLHQAWEQRDIDVIYETPYQALIVASIVEKEASIPEERDEIAGVLMRRLSHNMRLQMDPTVIYAKGPFFTGKLTKADLKVASPYNTYIHKGLPPTPIAMVSRASIDSALHPAPGKSLYFVAKGDGSHHFSDTLEEHNQAVLKYIIQPKATEEAQDAVKSPADNPGRH